ncbi:unnamed protein product [Parnassius mnemosyne]|uniref:Uncharacterized protein n=1 Tax=Parnassius mnemosyne TaxID=213953 RepID=A0AAV1L2G8_9NEOP
MRVDLNWDNWSGENFDCYYIKQDHLDFNVCCENGEPQSWLDTSIKKNRNYVPGRDQVSPKDWSPARKALNCGDNTTNAFCTAEHMRRSDNSWLPDDEDPRRIKEIVYDNAEDEWDAKSIVSVDSWEEFVRGATVVPHSSEIELNVSNVLSDVELDENSLAYLSSERFSAEIQTHARALRQLLHEDSQRQRMYSRGLLEIIPRAETAFNSYDEYLSRDINPSELYTPSNCKTLRHEKASTTEDLHAAGSYKNVDLGVGKGRGRLHVAQINDSRKGVIGIGRGRPFRL